MVGAGATVFAGRNLELEVFRGNRDQGNLVAMLIEFIGAAGSGKSFLTDRALDSLVARGLAARDFDLQAIKKTDPRTIYLTVRAMYLGVKTKPRSLSALAEAAAMIARYSIRREYSEKSRDISITSEGLFHRIITLQRKSRGLDMTQIAEILFQRVQPSDVVVVVEAKPEIVFTRRSHRNRVNDIFSRESVKADIAIVNESIDVITYIQRTLRPSMRILRVRADEEGGDAALAQILDVLEVSNDDIPNAPL